MPRHIRLSLAGLPVFASTPTLCCIDPDTEEALKALPDTYCRLRVASRFLQRFGGCTEWLNVRDEELLPMWAGYLRAALMEYAGMEDSTRVDIRRLGLRARPVSVDDTGNAMLILMRELRNLHVHVVQTRFTTATRTAVLRTAKPPSPSALASGAEEITTDLEIITIPRDDLDCLLERRVARRFDNRELRDAIDWLDEAQQRWGIRDVVLAALDHYSVLAVRAISPGAT